jgi:hypothetical protein
VVAAALRDALGDYPAIRRPLGFRLVRLQKLLTRFLDRLDVAGSETLTLEAALAWSCSPTGGDVNWWAYRLSVARGFGTHCPPFDRTVAVSSKRSTHGVSIPAV